MVLILLLPFFTIAKLPIINILIDLVASVGLLYGTHCRKELLRGADLVSNPSAGMQADENKVYLFLSMSITCWMASSVLEIRSVRFLHKISLGSYNVCDMPWAGRARLIVGLLASANSCWVMLNYSSKVHKSFDGISRDNWILVYFCCAAFAKNIRVFFQGEFLPAECFNKGAWPIVFNLSTSVTFLCSCSLSLNRTHFYQLDWPVLDFPSST